MGDGRRSKGRFVKVRKCWLESLLKVADLGELGGEACIVRDNMVVLGKDVSQQVTGSCQSAFSRAEEHFCD